MWEQTQLAQIVNADDLHIAPLRIHEERCGTPTWIWCVAVDDELYVRAYSGTSSRWYQAAKARGQGQIHAADQVFNVRFETVDDPAVNAQIDEAYRTKYAGSAYLKPMISERARQATVKITPAP